jgi:hypothetical protein
MLRRIWCIVGGLERARVGLFGQYSPRVEICLHTEFSWSCPTINEFSWCGMSERDSECGKSECSGLHGESMSG